MLCDDVGVVVGRRRRQQQQQQNRQRVLLLRRDRFSRDLTAGVVVGPLKNNAKTFSLVECQDASSSSTNDDDDDDWPTVPKAAAREKNNNNNNNNEKKRYRIAHRTFRSEFSFVNNCLRLARNVANPTSIAAPISRNSWNSSMRTLCHVERGVLLFLRRRRRRRRRRERRKRGGRQ